MTPSPDYRALLDMAVEALKPFAKAGDQLTLESPTDMAVVFSADGFHVRLMDFRAARSTLATIKQKMEGE